MKRAYRLLRFGLDLVAYNYMSAVFAADTDMHNGAVVVAVAGGNVRYFDKLFIAGKHLVAVDNGADAPACELLDFAYARFVYMAAVGTHYGCRDRVVGIAFGKRRNVKKLCGAIGVIVHAAHGKCALCNSACLVENNGFYLFHRFDAVCTLDKYTAARSCAYAAEKRKRNRYHKRAGAGNDKEHKRSGKPFGKIAAEGKRGKNGDKRRSRDNAGCVDVCKACDKAFRFCLAFHTVADHIEYLCNGAFAVNACRAYFKHRI